jgi:hypothetical protein
MVLVSILGLCLNHDPILVGPKPIVRPKGVVESEWPFRTRAWLYHNSLSSTLKKFEYYFISVHTILMQH